MPLSLRKHLQQLSHEELVEELLKLSKKFSDVKTYYAMDLGDSNQQASLVADYKTRLKKMYFPTRGYGNPKAAEVRKTISDFRKISVFPYDVIDMLLYRVELAVQFTNAYGDIDERFYSSTETAYEEALKLIRSHQLTADFRPRCLTIMRNTNGLGWGFGDQMSTLTHEYFP